MHVYYSIIVKRITLSIALAFLVMFNAQNVYAENAKIDIIDYKLPYTGILSDHPLYKLKKLRDSILLTTQVDPIEKARLHLHIADKTLLTALKIAEKGKTPLSIRTAFDGENHVTLMVTELKNAAYIGKKLENELLYKAHRAARKHQELLAGMSAEANATEKEKFNIILEFSSRNDNELYRLEKDISTPPANK